MYRVSPLTYIVEGLVGNGTAFFSFCSQFCILFRSVAVGNQLVNCSPVELVTLTPPSGQSCGSYMANYISGNGGYLANPDATSGCQFCVARTTDQFFGNNFNIERAHRWRNIGIVSAEVLFNVRPFLISLVFEHCADAVPRSLRFSSSRTYSACASAVSSLSSRGNEDL